MAQTLFRDLGLKEGTQQRLEENAYIFEERNPLDESRLREIETELLAIVGATKNSRVRITVLGLEDFQRAVKRIVPKRLIDKGLANHFRVLQDPRDVHHIIVGPSAISGLNDGQTTVITDLVYHMIFSSGTGSNQAFERGAADLIAKEIGNRLGLDVFSDQYPQEQQFVKAIIEAIKGNDDEVADLVGLLRRNPKQFFNLLKDSSFYRWWEGTARKDDSLSPFVDLIASITAPNAQLEGSFMAWAKSCAETYRDYRAQQRQNALAGAQKRAEGGASAA